MLWRRVVMQAWSRKRGAGMAAGRAGLMAWAAWRKFGPRKREHWALALDLACPCMPAQPSDQIALLRTSNLIRLHFCSVRSKNSRTEQK